MGQRFFDPTTTGHLRMVLERAEPGQAGLACEAPLGRVTAGIGKGHREICLRIPASASVDLIDLASCVVWRADHVPPASTSPTTPKPPADILGGLRTGRARGEASLFQMPTRRCKVVEGPSRVPYGCSAWLRSR